MRPGAGRKRMALLGLVGRAGVQPADHVAAAGRLVRARAQSVLFWVLLGLVTVYNALDAMGSSAGSLGHRRGAADRTRALLGAARGDGRPGRLLVAPLVGWVLDRGGAGTRGTAWAGQPHPLVFALVFAPRYGGRGRSPPGCWRAPRMPRWRSRPRRARGCSGRCAGPWPTPAAPLYHGAHDLELRSSGWRCRSSMSIC